MNEATIEVEGVRKPFGATVPPAGIDIRADAARGIRPTRAWKGVSP
jgi:hypothetical protein